MNKKGKKKNKNNVLPPQPDMADEDELLTQSISPEWANPTILCSAQNYSMSVPNPEFFRKMLSDASQWAQNASMEVAKAITTVTAGFVGDVDCQRVAARRL